MSANGGMNLLVVGSGGREHALVKSFATSPNCGALYCSPGNDGIARDCEILSGEHSLEHWVKEKSIDLVVFGPEQPLVDGEGDRLKSLTRVFGPSAAAAQLEGSKVFMKDVAVAAGVPTASYQVFEADQLDEALDYLAQRPLPIVIKASGLAAGKGVTVTASLDEAREAVRACLSGDAFGQAGHQVVIEECLVGPEVSVFHLVQDGRAKLIGAAQDHKRQLDGDKGPNTGGMGTFSPSPLFTPQLARQVEEQFVQPTLDEMARRGTPFEGFLFTGLMLTPQGPKLLEYNVRMGDPETQSLLPLLSGDLLTAIIEPQAELDVTEGCAVTVVLAAPGYPTQPEKGLSMPPLPQDSAQVRWTVAGAKQDRASEGPATGAEGWISTGGRVLGVTALGATHNEARKNAYDAVASYGWQAAQFRTDIGAQRSDNP